MKYIDNPNLSGAELSALRSAVNEWRNSSRIPCRPRSMGVFPSVAIARDIADNFSSLAPDIGRLVLSQNPCLSFFAFLTLDWIGSSLSNSYREGLKGRRFPVLDGCFVIERSLDDALDAAKLHFKLYNEESS